MSKCWQNMKLVCCCCGKSFDTEYEHGGAIEHDNYTNDYNMNIFVSRWIDADDDNKYKLFKESIKAGMQIFECRLLWLKKRGYYGVVKYLEGNRKNIEHEFINRNLRC